MAWVLGEYGYLSTTCSKEAIIEDLCQLAQQRVDSHTRFDDRTLFMSTFPSYFPVIEVYYYCVLTNRAYLVTAIMKLVAQNGSCPQKATKLIDEYSNSSSLDVYQRYLLGILHRQDYCHSCALLLDRCVEFKAMLRASGAMADALPVDASCEDIEVKLCRTRHCLFLTSLCSFQVDESLPMLENYVRKALAEGANPYTPPARSVSFL